MLESREIELPDVGVSGGVWGLEKGYCLVTGGKRSVYGRVVPIVDALAEDGGLFTAGPRGPGISSR